MTLEEELAEFFGRIDLVSPGCVRWDGLDLATRSLADTVQSLLYGSYYTRGRAWRARGLTALAVASLPSDRSLEPWLSRANASRARWDDGWKIHERRPDGGVAAHKGDRVRAFPPGSYRVDPATSSAQVWAPGARPCDGPGFSFVFGEEVGDQFEEADMMRFYFAVGAVEAPGLVEVVSRGLNTYQIPFRFKVLNDPALFPRADAAVLYVTRRYFAIVAQILEFAPQRLLGRLAPDVPLFTKAIRAGIGVADDTGTAESFGSHRCRLVAESVVELASRGLQDPAHRLERTRQRFAEEGLALSRPFLAPGNVDTFVDASIPSDTP